MTWRKQNKNVRFIENQPTVYPAQCVSLCLLRALRRVEREEMSMTINRAARQGFARRGFLKFVSAFSAASIAPSTLLQAQAQSQPQMCSAEIPQHHEPSNGGPCPYPIPWLDKNGNHNQPAMPNVELCSIYHFKGKLGRCSGFHGMGTDNKGNRLAWGTATTDYSYMAGEYWAARQAHEAVFAHT
jgi:hypothetical protein